MEKTKQFAVVIGSNKERAKENANMVCREATAFAKKIVSTEKEAEAYCKMFNRYNQTKHAIVKEL